MQSLPINRKAAQLEKLQEREFWHKIVVKILCWRDGLSSGGIIKSTDKITPKEWKTYCERMIKINISQGEVKVKEDLKKIRKIIKNFGGFR